MKKFVLFLTTSFLLVLTAGAQNTNREIPGGDLQVLATSPLGVATSHFTAAVDPNSFYSNISGYTGNGITNGGAATQAIVTSAGTVNGLITTMVADSLAFIGVGPYSVAGFSFSVANFNTAIVSARTRIRFYANDGVNGKPGTYITGFIYNPLAYAANNITTVTTTTIFSFPAGTTAVWAGLVFDNVNTAGTGTTGATVAQMNNMGQAVSTPIDRGSSSVTFFGTDLPGSFANTNNPVGGDYIVTTNAGATIVPQNFGWQLVAPPATVPVTIEFLHGAKTAGGNALAWKLGCPDADQAVMTLQRSADGRNFSSVYDLTANAARCAQEFNYTDSKPMSGINCYRLKIVNADGKASYSNIVSLTDKKAGFTLVNVQPNPTSDRLVLNIAGAQNDKVQISVHDINGRQVLTQTAQITAGSNPITVDVSKLQAGTYTITGMSSTLDCGKESIGFIKK